VSDYSRTSGDRAKYRQMFADAYRDYDSMYDAVDAVVAAVREDPLNEVTPDHRREHWVNEGRQAAARDIRADGADSCAEYYARIAEGGQS
jgi:hypothetical protein